MYAQNLEDKLFLEYFGEYKGHLLELGANNGRCLSNSLLMIENGWSATLVEPSPTVFPQLQELHKDNPKVRCLQVAVGDEDGEQILFESGGLLGEGDRSLVSTLVPTEKLRWKSLNMKFENVLVKVVSWGTLRKELPETVDFISVDIEGKDLDIIRQIDFKELGTKLVCVEWNSKDKWAYDHVMMQYGFRLLHSNAENLVYGI
jgi:FkbM family methyltransferase